MRDLLTNSTCTTKVLTDMVRNIADKTAKNTNMSVKNILRTSSQSGSGFVYFAYFFKVANTPENEWRILQEKSSEYPRERVPYPIGK